MKRYAAHYLYLAPGKVLKRHFLELDEQNRLKGVFPFNFEIAGTSFYNGILIITPENHFPNPQSILEQLKINQETDLSANIFSLLNQLEIPAVEENNPVSVYQLDGIDLPSSKLCTRDGRCNGYIQRL